MNPRAAMPDLRTFPPDLRTFPPVAAFDLILSHSVSLQIRPVICDVGGGTRPVPVARAHRRGVNARIPTHLHAAMACRRGLCICYVQASKAPIGEGASFASVVRQ